MYLINSFFHSLKKVIAALIFFCSVLIAVPSVLPGQSKQYYKKKEYHAYQKGKSRRNKARFKEIKEKKESYSMVVIGIIGSVALVAVGCIGYMIFTGVNENKDLLERIHDSDNSFKGYQYGGEKEKEWDNKISNFFPNDTVPIEFEHYKVNPSFIETSIIPEPQKNHRHAQFENTDFTEENSSAILVKKVKELVPEDRYFPMAYANLTYSKEKLIENFEHFHIKVNHMLDSKIRDYNQRMSIKKNILMAIDAIAKITDLDILQIHLSNMIPVYVQCETTAQDYIENNTDILNLANREVSRFSGYIYKFLQAEKEALVELLIPRFIAKLWMDQSKRGKGVYVLKHYKDYWISKIKAYLMSKGDFQKKKEKETKQEQEKREEEKRKRQFFIDRKLREMPSSQGNLKVSGTNTLLPEETWEETLINSIIYHINTNGAGRHTVAAFKKEIDRHMKETKGRHRRRFRGIGLGDKIGMIPDSPNRFIFEIPRFYNSTTEEFKKKVTSFINTDEPVVDVPTQLKTVRNFVKMFEKEFTVEKVYKIVYNHLLATFQAEGEKGNRLRDLYLKFLRDKKKEPTYKNGVLGFDQNKYNEGLYYFPDEETLKEALIMMNIIKYNKPRKKTGA